jgi:hypothetical protein
MDARLRRRFWTSILPAVSFRGRGRSAERRQQNETGLMEERQLRGPMQNLGRELSGNAPRRILFSRVCGAVAFGFSGLTAAPETRAAVTDDGPDWPGKLNGRHRQVIDGYRMTDGSVPRFADNFLECNAPGAAQVVVILRAGALPIALNSTIWAKYKIGESFGIIDPETNAPALKNPFLHPKPGALKSDDSAIDRLLAAGAVVGACALALRGQRQQLAHIAGASEADAVNEWAANVLPGITIIPSGVWGVNRAQEAGCTYCSGG